MDIQYLLFLQGIREATGGFFDEFFNALSKFAVDILPFLPYIIFWCVDKKWGYRFIAATWIGEVVNGIIKLSVCAYRPWIRSAEIEPAGDSQTAATGYSFPSGHSVVSALHYGNTAAWQWNRRRWISIVCIVLILLTGFSRNFLDILDYLVHGGHRERNACEYIAEMALPMGATRHDLQHGAVHVLWRSVLRLLDMHGDPSSSLALSCHDSS